MEEWKDVPDFPHYQASTDGNIRSFQKSKDTPKLLSQTPVGREGHLRVFLYKDNIKHPLLVHRVIAETFIDNPDNFPVVRHRDDNPTNNRVENLLWGTQKDNVHDCIEHSGMNYSGFSRYNNERKTPIIATDVSTGMTTVFESQNDAARALGIRQGNIWKSLRNHTKTSGYLFEYTKKEEDGDV